MLAALGLSVESQAAIPVRYRELSFGEGFRADLLVARRIIGELNVIERVQPVHKKQILAYLSLTKLRSGLLLNFGAALLKDGITRPANGC